MYGSVRTIAVLLLVSSSAPRAYATEAPVRIGYQKYGTLLLLKESGAIDLGVAGEAPPIFAQAAEHRRLIPRHISLSDALPGTKP